MAEPRSITRMLAHTDPPWAVARIIELELEVERLRAALADLLGNSGCLCDHPLVTGPCSKCRAARVLDGDSGAST